MLNGEKFAMSLIKCPECGSEISNTSTQCIKCGAIIKNKKKSNKLFVGFLLNILSVIIPALLIIGINQMPTYEPSGETTIEMNAEYSSSMLLIIMAVGLLIFALGLVIYFIKNQKIQRIFSVVYLLVAIADFCLLVTNTLTYLITTCGLGVVLFVPGILQIIAGVKYITGTRKNEA